VNVVRIARIVRTLRRRRGWRQADLGGRAKVSQQAVSLVECAQATRLSIKTLERILTALEADIDLVVRWRDGQLERLLDEGHAQLMGRLAVRLEAAGWLVRTEVTYARFGERGSVDLLAFKEDRKALLVTEIKTEITSADGTLRKHDEKTRLGREVASERFGWQSKTVSRLLVLPDAATPRRHISRQDGLFERAYPLRGTELRAWLRDPAETVSGVLFLPTTKGVGARQELTSRRRIRRPDSLPAERGPVRPAARQA
jgi:transcriptional regulator with XRE-family HTH domain